jgi:hypothetical protein
MSVPANNNILSGKLILTPNETKRVLFTGSYISVLTNTASRDVFVSANSGNFTQLKAGVGFPTVRISDDRTTHVPTLYNYVEFNNPSDTETMTIEFLLSLGSVDDTRTVVQGYLQMDLSAPKLESPAALTVQTNALTTLQSNALIKERIVQNTGDNPVWYGDEYVDPANGRGIMIVPFGSASINCWGAVCFKAQGGASRISVVNILKVA